MRKLGFALLATAVLSAPAMAQQGGVKVGGNLTNTTSVGSAVNAAIGKDNKAVLRVGAIGGNVNVGGNLTNTTTVKTAVNAAIGKGNTACMELGTIGDTACR